MASSPLELDTAKPSHSLPSAPQRHDGHEVCVLWTMCADNQTLRTGGESAQI